ncbi:MAG: twin-arginine translocase subunit TatE [Glaciecola sp.]|jgi:sec-independent protein translocase protein TatA|nr:twin-arginine translocase subunit TatE [Glaciecola sp.]MDG2099288.1 twin-arginine translocase subunit TatE [Glaciecola sp.]
MGGISIWSLLLIALIVILLFGTGKLKTLGADLGGAIKGFKKAVNDDSAAEKNTTDADFSPEQISTKADEKVNSTVSQEVKKD